MKMYNCTREGGLGGHKPAIGWVEHIRSLRVRQINCHSDAHNFIMSGSKFQRSIEHMTP